MGGKPLASVLWRVKNSWHEHFQSTRVVATQVVAEFLLLGRFHETFQTRRSRRPATPRPRPRLHAGGVGTGGQQQRWLCGAG
ncbi:hypothetical protein SGPA1_20083 [Streptomyces misionensis JCM 4497]